MLRHGEDPVPEASSQKKKKKKTAPDTYTVLPKLFRINLVGKKTEFSRLSFSLLVAILSY